MSKDLFIQTLRDFRWREPPQPFVIELMDGARIEVDDPMAMGFVEGEGFFLSPSYNIIKFSCDNVLRIQAAREAVS